VLFFDFILLLYFFAGITDVDWQSPLSVNLAFATVLAAMVTVLTYGFLSFTGHRMRSPRTMRARCTWMNWTVSPRPRSGSPRRSSRCWLS
jgi:hypothetical protein